MYQIEDMQIPGRLFADGQRYKNRKEVIEQLLDYHNIDFDGTDNKDNELDIYDFLKFWKINTTKKQLEWVLDYGQWELVKV